MDIEAIDREYEQLQSQAQQTIGEIQTLSDKLRAANLAGNQDAREWMLDLKEIALAIQAEQNQVSTLLQALHGFVASRAEQVAPAPQSPGAWGAQPAQQPGGGMGGMFANFMGSGFGRAAVAGAGFGIGDVAISRLFGGRGGC